MTYNAIYINLVGFFLNFAPDRDMGFCGYGALPPTRSNDAASSTFRINNILYATSGLASCQSSVAAHFVQHPVSLIFDIH